MFYMQYLSSLCHRRQWAEPMYQPYATRQGYKCVVRVNNREYSTDRMYESEVLATENAAMRAYLICRNFSVNDGRVPTSAAHRHAESSLQGRPVAIGTERRSTSYYTEDTDGSLSSGSRSGGSSPGSAEFPVSYRTEGRRSSRDVGRVLSYGGSRRR